MIMPTDTMPVKLDFDIPFDVVGAGAIPEAAGKEQESIFDVG